MKPLAAASALAAILAAPGAAVAADDPASRILDLELRDGRGYAKLAWLCDRIGPRLAGSEGLEHAVSWTAEEMKRDGLENVRAEPAMVPHWVRGTGAGRIVAPVERDLPLLALGMSEPTPPEGITAEVLEVGSLEELAAAGDKAKGKIVLFNRKIYANGGEDRGYGAGAGLRYNGPSAAARLGAVGMLIRSLGTADFRLPHTGGTGYAADAPRIPGAAITAEDAELIHRLLVAGDTVKVSFTLTCKTLPDAPSANVVGEIRGREKPEEVVVIGGHLDSWDVGCGAHDDGAGVAIVMEAMRVLKTLGFRPRRTLRVVLFTNEENGLRGGKAYADAHAAELPRHVAAIESDGGGFRPLGLGVSAGPGAADIVRVLARPLAAIAADDVRDGGGGADISPMIPGGVPQIALRQDGTRYFDYHHTQADTLDKVDPHELAMNAAAMAVIAYALADAEETLPRLPGPDKQP